MLAEIKVPTEAAQGPTHVIDRIAATVRQVQEQAGLTPALLKTVAVGSPGPLSIGSGMVHFAPNLRWHNVPIREMLQERVHVKVLLDNDANLAAWGEYVYGAGQGFKNVIYITVSTGIGGGLILDGRLYHGSTDGAGEIGHTIVSPDGPLCACGARGCLEALSSGTAIANAARRLLEQGQGQNILSLAGGRPEAIQAVTVATAAAAGDPEATALISQAAHFLGLGLANIINLFNPDLIVLGGGVMQIGPPIWQGLRQSVERHALAAPLAHAQIVPAALGQRAGLLGAIALALQENGPAPE